MASGSPVKCHLAADAIEAIHKFATGEFDHVVLKCVTNKETIVVDSSEESKIPLEDIAQDLPDTSPRFVLLHFTTQDDPSFASNYQVLIYFNPMDTLPSIKRSYELSMQSVEAALTALKNLKVVTINDILDLTPVNLMVSIQGLKGTASDKLDAKFKTYGREKV